MTIQNLKKNNKGVSGHTDYSLDGGEGGGGGVVSTPLDFTDPNVTLRMVLNLFRLLNVRNTQYTHMSFSLSFK